MNTLPLCQTRSGAATFDFRSVPLGTHFDTTTTRQRDSLSPRRRSGERGFMKGLHLRLNVPLSPTLSPLVPRGEREKRGLTLVVVSGCALPFILFILVPVIGLHKHPHMRHVLFLLATVTALSVGAQT